MAKQVNLSPSDGKWKITFHEITGESEKTFDKKEDAEEYGKKKAKDHNAEFIPRNADGTISNPNSYGGDPNPPKDKKH